VRKHCIRLDRKQRCLLFVSTACACGDTLDQPGCRQYWGAVVNRAPGPAGRELSRPRVRQL